MATALPDNIRTLEHGLARLVAYTSLRARRIDTDLVYRVLQQLETESQQPVTVLQIQRTVAKRFGLTRRVLQSRKRHQAVAFPRQVAMFLCRDMTNTAISEIGQQFGGRDANTVLHACGKVLHMQNTSEEVAQLLWELRHALRQ